MQISKALELNDESEKSLRKHKFIDHADAIQLGIEALKREKEHRELDIDTRFGLLPGEDPEPAPTRSLHHIKAVLESPLGKQPDLHQPPGEAPE
ncbi:hypothetical protein ES703_117355 [subsurface metagenome]